MEKPRQSCGRTTFETEHRDRSKAKKDEVEGVEFNIEKSKTEQLRAKGHHYCISTIKLAVQLLIECGISLRGAEKTLKLSKSSAHKTPNFSSPLKWLVRIGLYELNRKKEYRNDWIFIIDLTVELGKQKALVVVGVSQKHLVEKVLPYNRGLSHQDVELLALEIMDSTKGELIAQKLEQLSQTVGIPRQIVSDRGCDIASGIKLYQQNHPTVVTTHDVTHAMALILKHELATSAQYQSFLQQCGQCRQQLQQTELSFLSPPSQRSMCRYFNVEKLVDWGIKLLNSPLDTLIKLLPTIDPSILEQKLQG